MLRGRQPNHSPLHCERLPGCSARCMRRLVFGCVFGCIVVYRLTQEVTSLEIQPTIEDVFHADTSNVEDYLRQVEESTILAAIQVCVCVRVRACFCCRVAAL